MRVGALLFGLIMLSSGAAAADEPICADRPGKSTGTCTVSLGRWQLEAGIAGWSLHKDGGLRETALTLGETALRIGLSPRSEVQVTATPWHQVTVGGGGLGERASGIGDVSVLYKHRLTGDGSALQLAVAPTVKIPTAKRPLGNGKVEAALMLPIDIAIGSSPFSLNLTPEVAWAADADGRGHHAAMVQVASLGWQATQKLSLSAEIWAQWDWDKAGTSRQASADATVAYLLSKDVQVDAGANFGLNRATPDVEVYFGIAKRF